MDIFSKRPLFLSCMLFLACAVAGYFMEGTLKVVIIIITAIALIFALMLAIFRYHSADKKNIFLTVIICILMMLLSFASSYNYYDMGSRKYAKIYDTECMIEATVSGVNYENNFSSKYEIQVTNVNGKKDDYTALLECEYSGALRVGDKVAVKAIANELPEESSARFSERADAISNGIFVIFTSDDESQLSVVEYTENNDPATILPGINKYLSDILTGEIGGEAGNLSSALLLGNKSLLSSQAERDFRRVGASHILALSGMHMSIIMGFAMFLMKPVFKKRSIAVIILSVFALFYLALTGFSVSATRSVIMLLMVYIAYIVLGVPDSLTALAFAGFLIVLVTPGAILDAGFWMSFSATLGILVFVSALNDKFQERLEKCESKRELKIRKVFYSIVSAVVTCFAALIPLIIVMCIFIKEMSALSVLSSLVLSIPTTALIILSLLLLPLSAIPYVSELLVWAIRNVAGFMLGYCDKISDMEGIVFSLNYPFATVMAITLGAALLYCFASRHKIKILSLIPFVACLIAFGGVMCVYEYTNKDNLNASYINCSQRSDIIVLSDEREVVICDLSNGSKKAYGLALDEVYESRSTEISAILMTRYTNAHIATYYSLFAENKVRSVWAPYPENSDEQYQLERLYSIAGQNGVDVYVYNPGDRLLAFKTVIIEHSRDYIERSTVPIDLLGIFTGRECLTYVSPAFGESSIGDKAKYYITGSKYVIFGSRGPTVKKGFEIERAGRIRAIAFANSDVIAYLDMPQSPLVSYYHVEKESEMEFYLAQ